MPRDPNSLISKGKSECRRKTEAPIQVQCVLGRQYEGDIKGNLNAVRLAKLAVGKSQTQEGREGGNRIKPAKDGVAAEGKAGTTSVPFS